MSPKSGIRVDKCEAARKSLASEHTQKCGSRTEAKDGKTPTRSEPYAMLVRKNARAVTQKIRGYKFENPSSSSNIAANFGEPIAILRKRANFAWIMRGRTEELG